MRSATQDNVVRLPQTFEPVDFEGVRISEKHKADAAHVHTLQNLLASTPQDLRKTLAYLGAELGATFADRLISDFERMSEEYATLSDMFTVAVARMRFIRSNSLPPAGSGE